MDDDIHFRNEEIKKAGLGGGGWGAIGEWWEEKRQQRKGRGRKNASLGSDQSGRRTAVFLLTPGSSGDRRLCVRMCVRSLSWGSSVSVSWGCGRAWEKALVACKKRSVVLKQYQLHGNCQGEQSMTQSKEGKTTRKETKCNTAMRGGKEEIQQRDRVEGMNVMRKKIYLVSSEECFSGEVWNEGNREREGSAFTYMCRDGVVLECRRPVVQRLASVGGPLLSG